MKNEPAKSFEDLIVWQKAHQLVLEVYKMTESFPKTEIYGLTSQLRRAAISVPANIAEGFKKNSRSDKLRFLNIAQGSLEECRYYLVLTKDLNYGEPEAQRMQLDEVCRLLQGYGNGIRRRMLAGAAAIALGLSALGFTLSSLLTPFS